MNQQRTHEPVVLRATDRRVPPSAVIPEQQIAGRQFIIRCSLSHLLEQRNQELSISESVRRDVCSVEDSAIPYQSVAADNILGMSRIA